jgi:hypothetical protein
VEDRPAVEDDEFEELGAVLRWSDTLYRWVRPTCPLHGEGSEHG